MNIYERISKVMQDVEYLAKDDKVITNQKTNAGYKAVSEEKVTSTVRQSLIKNGIVIIPIKQEHRREDEIVESEYQGNITKKINRIATVDVTYRIQNIEDVNDYIEAVSSGTGVDTQDKGVGKAMTYAYKYLLLRTFAIPTGEDPDKIASDVYSQQFEEQPKDNLLTKSEADSLHKVLLNTGLTEEKIIETLQKGYKVNSTAELHKSQYAEILRKLNKGDK